MADPQPQSQLIGTPAFRLADMFTAAAEGGYTANDGTGHAAAGGVDQTAHPGINVSALNAQQAQQIRYGYWRAINGDAIAAENPALARAVYDTAIMTGPQRALEMMPAANGNVAQYLAIRQGYLDSLVQQNPKKYGPVAQGWRNRTASLALQGGSQPQQYPWAPNAPVDTPSPAEAPKTPAQTFAGNFEMPNVILPNTRATRRLSTIAAQPLTVSSPQATYQELLNPPLVQIPEDQTTS